MTSNKYISGAALLANATGGEPSSFPPDSALGQHPQWDSVSHINVMLELEKEFGVIIDDASIEKYSRLSAIDELIRTTV